MVVRFRYSVWDGTQDVPEFGADDILDSLTDDLMNFGDLQHALRNLMGAQSAAGLLAPDDTENFERSTDNLLARPGPDHPFHYAMGLGHENDPGLRERLREQGVDAAHLPGRIGPYNAEANQRDFYRYWAELMARQPPAGAVNGA